MYGIKVEMNKLNEDGSVREGDTEEHWIVNLQESGGTYSNPRGNVLKLETFEEADKMAKQMRLKSYSIVEV